MLAVSTWTAADVAYPQVIAIVIRSVPFLFVVDKRQYSIAVGAICRRGGGLARSTSRRDSK